MRYSSKFPLGSMRCLSLWLAVSSLASAGVVSDGSRGSVVSHAGSDFGITGGAKVGGNLFHSFSQFDLVRSESATFSGPSDVANILARVTGGAASSIDGTIRSTIPNANLFLMNPRGFVFGPNVKLDISGSFAVTTADYLKLSDGGRLSARIGGRDLLTSASVSAFGFLSSSPAPVSFNGSHITTLTGKAFYIAAGDISLDGAILSTPSGRLSLVSVASAGEVTSSSAALAALPANVVPAMGTISLKNHSAAGIGGAGGGNLVIRGGRLQLTAGGSVQSRNTGAHRGGDVNVRVTDGINIHGGRIKSLATGAGDGGSVRVSAARLVIAQNQGSKSNGIFAEVGSHATGHGGDVTVESNNVTVSGGSRITSATAGAGPSGNVTVSAANITISGALPNGAQASAIHTNSQKGAPGSQAGKVTVSASGKLLLTGGGQISSHTNGSGTAGSVSVNAANITISGATPNNKFVSEIDANSMSDLGGKAGDVTVSTPGSLHLLGGGQIASQTSGSGTGGNVTVNAASVAISGATPDGMMVSEIDADSTASKRGGDAGSVTVLSSGPLNLGAGGKISSETHGTRNSGKISMHAGSLSIDGAAAGGQQSGIAANSDAGATGNAGGVQIAIDGAVHLSNGAVISTTSAGEGNAGRVNLTAGDSVSLSGGSSISVSAVNANAGLVSVSAPHRIELHDGSRISAAAGGAGGNILISAGNMFYLDHGGIEATAGSSLLAGAQSGGRGAGGNIAIDPTFTILDHGDISANSALGAGGNIRLAARFFFSSESPITATGSTAGRVTITAPALDLSGALSGLTTQFVDASAQFQERCALHFEGGMSSFLIIGRGGVEDSPDQPAVEPPFADTKLKTHSKGGAR